MKNVRKFIEENANEIHSTVRMDSSGCVYYNLKSGQTVIYESDGSISLKTRLEDIEENDILSIANVGLLNFFNGSCLITLDEYFSKKYLKGYGLYLLKQELENDLIKREIKQNKCKI